MNSHQRRVARRAQERRWAEAQAWADDVRARFLALPDPVILTLKSVLSDEDVDAFIAELYKVTQDQSWHEIRIVGDDDEQTDRTDTSAGPV